MKKMLFLLLISFWQLNSNCQNTIKDSLPEYELLLDKLPKFLERNIVNWQEQSELFSEKKICRFRHFIY